MKDAIEVFVAHHPDQGYRLDLVGSTEKRTWAKMADAADRKDTSRARKEARDYGWTIVPMILQRRSADV